MRIIGFSPFGSASQETGIIYLLMRYLREVHPGVAQLKCNGLFPLCERDQLGSGVRNLLSCTTCIQEQKVLARWSDVESLELSRYLTADDLELARSWMLQNSTESLMRAKFNDLTPFALAEELFYQRLQMRELDLKNIQHSQLLKRVVLSVLHALLASRRFVAIVRPDISLVAASGRDYISSSFVLQSEKASRPVAFCRWEAATRSVAIRRTGSEQSFQCSISFENFHRMRADVKSWSGELVGILDELLSYLQIPMDQVILPIAAN
jgi:general stress protein CsbA